jgi:phosphohistidine phosphatase
MAIRRDGLIGPYYRGAPSTTGPGGLPRLILYFLRHGNAGHHSAAADDDLRELTAGGVAALRSAAGIWRRLNLRPDVVISSPLPRALRTAELFVEGIGLSREPVIDDRLRPGAGWGDLARAMASHSEARRVMFVGHEPDLSSAVCLLTGAAAVRLRKGGVACVEFPGVPEPGSGELAWLIDPDLYDDGPEVGG